MSASVCVECSKDIPAEEAHVEASDDGRILCTGCYDGLVSLAAEYGDAQAPVNWPTAVLGAVAGGAFGAALWAAIPPSVLGSMHALLGLVIGFAAGQGALLGNQRGRASALQWMAAVVAAVAFFVGRALVVRGLSPTPEIGPVDYILMAVVVYEAWVIPKPG